MASRNNDENRSNDEDQFSNQDNSLMENEDEYIVVEVEEADGNNAADSPEELSSTRALVLELINQLENNFVALSMLHDLRRRLRYLRNQMANPTQENPRPSFRTTGPGGPSGLQAPIGNILYTPIPTARAFSENSTLEQDYQFYNYLFPPNPSEFPFAHYGLNSANYFDGPSPTFNVPPQNGYYPPFVIGSIGSQSFQQSSMFGGPGNFIPPNQIPAARRVEMFNDVTITVNGMAVDNFLINNVFASVGPIQSIQVFHYTTVITYYYIYVYL